jgi:hypothetical protein
VSGVRIVEWWKSPGVIGKINEERLSGVDKRSRAGGDGLPVK